MKKSAERKLVELGRKRIPLRKLIHSKEIRDAAKALEDCRLLFKEEEFFQRARLTLKWEPGGDCYLLAHREETDNEYADRLEKQRQVKEAREARERARREHEAELKRKVEAQRRLQTIRTLQELIQKNQISKEELEQLLKSS